MNPFAKMTIKNDPKSIDNIKITPNQIVIENLIKRTQEIEEQEPKERRKIQILSLNNEIQRSTDFIYQEDEEETKYIGMKLFFSQFGSLYHSINRVSKDFNLRPWNSYQKKIISL
jgi:hypothetical protein